MKPDTKYASINWCDHLYIVKVLHKVSSLQKRKGTLTVYYINRERGYSTKMDEGFIYAWDYSSRKVIKEYTNIADVIVDYPELLNNKIVYD